MTKTVTRLFDSHTEALRAVDDLERAGIHHDRISLVSNNADNWHAGHHHDEAKARGGPLGDRNGDGENDVADGAGKGAATGGMIGGAGGLLAGLGMLAIPGLGPVVAAGWLASTAVGAAIGAAAGGATGGLLGALKEAGHSDDDAHVFAEGVRRGGTLVSVKVEGDDAARLEQILDEQRGITAQMRGQAYRDTGWTRFDPEAQPYTVEEVQVERSRFAENRSFANQGGGETFTETGRSTGQAGGDIVKPIPGVDR
ncbi:hypothetical protein [Phenylobacterium sp.]|uniref:hypothetical protein n=1 Tax=Phenylobacterium sp. TaxID=1871053 RepID=UPI0027302713|nr:hypothetical protein [Phenylobacterium sp.]MDP1875064.1 hypothetical protein [Phenylobacterium sp.]MDP3489403.1 hypothetical protein [Phenylobacterium sp.]